MFLQSAIAIFYAVRMLFKSRRVLALMLAAYAGLLAAVYLFVSTREATIGQLVLTTALVVVAPVLFFVLQGLSVSYASHLTLSGLMRKLTRDCIKFVVVSLPVIGLTLLALYGLKKLDNYKTVATTVRYLLIGVAAPLLTIQLWVATTSNGLSSLLHSLRRIVVKTFAPQSVFVYACGFVIFAVAPYFLIVKTIPSEKAWLEFSLLVVRLSAAALLILLGWVTTVGALSILNRGSYTLSEEKINKE